VTAPASVRSPLAGCRVLVTRAREQASSLTVRLEQLGAAVIELPTIMIVPADPGPIDGAIRNLAGYDWIVFTSANAVEAFVGRLEVADPGRGAAALASTLIGAIGQTTASRLHERGYQTEFVPERFVAESVVEGMRALGVSGKRVLLPTADIAGDTLPVGLRNAGAIVDIVIAYQTEMPDDLDSDAMRDLLESVDIATFASPSSVRNMIALAGGLVPSPRAVCIGPITANAAREAGLTVAGVANEFTIPGLVEAIVRLVEDDQKEVPDGDQA